MDIARQLVSLSDRETEGAVRAAKSFLMNLIRKEAYSDMLGNEEPEMLSKKELKDIYATKPSLQMTGRKFADCAVLFAFAGIYDEQLYGLLDICLHSELKRFGNRTSCRSVDILQMIEKLALAGVRGGKSFGMAADLLSEKGFPNLKYISRLRTGAYSLLDDRPLLTLWRHATRQKKEKNRLIRAVHSPLDFDKLFANSSLPLYIDVGCGFGVSNIALANATTHNSVGIINTLGCDLARGAVRFSTGISKRWGLHSHCVFVHSDAVSCLRYYL